MTKHRNANWIIGNFCYCAVCTHTSGVYLLLSVHPKGEAAIHSKERCPLGKDGAQRQDSYFFVQISHQICRSLNTEGILNISISGLIQSGEASSSLATGNHWKSILLLAATKYTPTNLSLLLQDSWCFHHWNISWGFNIGEVSVTERCVLGYAVSYRHL